MSTTHTATLPMAQSSRVWAFVRHYLEMVIAMAVGMVALAPLWSWLFAQTGLTQLFSRPDLSCLVMATDMTIVMALWMRVRGHGWAPIAEMGAAMYLPFLVLFVPLWTGLISAHTLVVAGHLLMLVAMAMAMLLRPDEYTHAHHRHHGARRHDMPASRK